MEKSWKNSLAIAKRYALFRINTLWWFLYWNSIYIQEIKTDESPMQRYWRLKNNWILLVVRITLHAEACLFTNNKFGLFFSLTPIYIQKVKVKYQYFQEIMTIKKYSNPRAFWGICSHACSKVINCACFFHLYLSASRKSKPDVYPSVQGTLMSAQFQLWLRLLFHFSQKRINSQKFWRFLIFDEYTPKWT